MEDLINSPLNLKRKHKRYWYNGKHWTVRELADAFKLSYDALYARLVRSQWSVERAISEALHTKKARPASNYVKHRFRYKGRNYSIRELCQQFGFSYTTLHQRLIISRWPVNKAIETPVDKRKSRSKDAD